MAATDPGLRRGQALEDFKKKRASIRRAYPGPSGQGAVPTLGGGSLPPQMGGPSAVAGSPAGIFPPKVG